MAGLIIQPQVPATQGIGKTPVVPARQSAAQGTTDSLQQEAQKFLSSLSPDIRERVSQTPRDGARRFKYEENDQKQDASLDETFAPNKSSSEYAFDGNSPLNADNVQYSAPVYAGNAVLLQAQDISQSFEQPLTNYQRDAYFDAYVSAGAQPGGEAAAFNAQIRQEEQQNKLLVVPPVLTNVNFFT
jgi:hypothetical protein